eukprot:7296878-Prorocentrum_lima.AAC.1
MMPLCGTGTRSMQRVAKRDAANKNTLKDIFDNHGLAAAFGSLTLQVARQPAALGKRGRSAESSSGSSDVSVESDH